MRPHDLRDQPHSTMQRSDISVRATTEEEGADERAFNEPLQWVNEMSTPLNQPASSHLKQQPHEVHVNE